MLADPVRGRRWADHSRTLEAIAWKYRTGSPWRDLPDELGSFQTAHKRLIRWALDGTWESCFPHFSQWPMVLTVSPRSCRWTPRSAGLISMPPAPGKRGSRRDRARRPRTRTLSRRLEHKDPPRQRQPCTAPRPPCHRGPDGRRPGLRDLHGRHPSSARRSRKTKDPTRCRPGGPRVLLPCDPKSPSPTRHWSCHPAALRSGRPPTAARPCRRSPTGFGRRGIQAAQHGRTLHQPDQAAARPGHADGQARPRLSGRTSPGRDPDLGLAIARCRGSTAHANPQVRSPCPQGASHVRMPRSR